MKRHPKETQPLPGALPQPASAWSPDTDDGRSLISRTSRVASSIYSMSPQMSEVPPVPAVPENLKAKRKDVRRTTIIISDDEEEDAETPVTLFEESPVFTPEVSSARRHARAPTDASSRSQGWWDQITTPFRPSPVERLPIGSNSPKGGDDSAEWWKERDEKKIFAVREAAQDSGSSSSTVTTLRRVVGGRGREADPVAQAATRTEVTSRTVTQKKPSLQIVVQAPRHQ